MENLRIVEGGAVCPRCKVTEDRFGLCPSCGVEMAECETCCGIGYHAETCALADQPVHALPRKKSFREIAAQMRRDEFRRKNGRQFGRRCGGGCAR